jgi:hypothetical protein
VNLLDELKAKRARLDALEVEAAAIRAELNSLIAVLRPVPLREGGGVPARVRALADERGPMGFSAKDVERMYAGPNARSTAAVTLTRMVRRGDIKRASHGHYVGPDQLQEPA